MRTDKRIDALTFSPRFLRLGSALLLTIVAASSHADSNAVRDADDSRISVASVAGDVDFTMAGNTVEASPNDTVLLPAHIVTGHDGNVGLTQAGTNVSVANDSDVEIPAEAVDGNLIARMVQHRGNVFYDVAPRDLGKLRVETPFLVAVIKGTQFNVAVDERGTTISLFEGSLEIHTPDDSDIIQLNAGEIAIRSLIDSSIRVVGMDDERIAIPPPAAPQAADESASPAAADESAPPVTAPAAETVAVADDAAAVRASSNDAVAIEAAKPSVAEHEGIRAGVDLAVARPSIAVTTVEVGGGALVDLGIDSAVELIDLGRGVGLETDAELGGKPSIDIAADTGVELRIDDASLDLGGKPSVDVGVDPGVDLRIEPGLDLGGALDPEPALELDPILEAGVDLTLDTGSVDVALDAGGGTLDLALDVDVGANKPVVDLQLDIDPALRVPVPVPRGALLDDLSKL